MPKNHGSLKGLRGGRQFMQALTPGQLAKEVLDQHIPRDSTNYELYLNAFNREIRRRLYDLNEEKCDEEARPIIVDDDETDEPDQ